MKLFVLVSLLTVLQIVNVSTGAKVEITLYVNEDYTGQSVTLNQTNKDFECVTKTLGMGNGFKSVCYIGSWSTTTKGATMVYRPAATRKCDIIPYYIPELRFEHVTRVYQIGPVDTSTEAITFHTLPTEKIVENAEAYLNVTSGVIAITRIYTQGLSNWTMYDLPSFTGNSACVTPTKNVELHKAPHFFGLKQIYSVRKGCDY